MAIVVKVSNLINKNKNKDGVKEFLAALPNPEAWTSFVEGELQKSLDTNNKNLGGQQPRNPIDDDDNDKDYEMDMDKIMAKFSSFNSSMSSKENQSNNDAEDDDDDKHQEIEEDDEPKQDSPQKDHQDNESNQIETSQQPLRTTQVDL